MQSLFEITRSVCMGEKGALKSLLRLPVLFVEEKKLFIKLTIPLSSVDVTLIKQIKLRNIDDTLNDSTCLIFRHHIIIITCT